MQMLTHSNLQVVVSRLTCLGLTKSKRYFSVFYEDIAKGLEFNEKEFATKNINSCLICGCSR